MSVDQPYLDEEMEWLGDWPPSPPDKFGPSQYSRLAEELKTNIRSRAIRQGIAPKDYWRTLTDAKELFDDLRNWMNLADHMTDKQRESFDSQCFWYHKKPYEGGLSDRKQDVWPISRNELTQDVRRYLEMPLMWSDSLDYLLTDALIYAEVAAFRETIVGKGVLIWALGGGDAPWYLRLPGSLLKWSVILIALATSYEVSRELFVVLSIGVIAYQLRKSFVESPVAKKTSLYLGMVGVYHSCDSRYYNASAIWEMCQSVREKGAVFDGVLYDLLEKQRARSAGKWASLQATASDA